MDSSNESDKGTDLNNGGETPEPDGPPLAKLLESESNLEADLDLLKFRLLNFTAQDRRKVHNLIRAGLRMPQNSDLQSSSSGLQVQEPRTHNQISSIRSRINPLNIHLIFHEILGYLPMNDLLNCRLVNRIWNSKAIPWIQEKMIEGVLIKPKDFPRFCIDFQDTEVLPVVKLSIDLDDVTIRHCSKFFTKHGHDIRDLNLAETSDTPIESLNQANLKKVRIIFRSVPNLKKLSLDLSFISEAVPQKFIFSLGALTLPEVECLSISSLSPLNKEFIEGLFAMLPRLNTVKLGYFGLRQNWDLLATAVQNIRNLHLDVKISAQPTAPWRAMVAQGALKLKELSIGLESDSVSLDYLHQLGAQKEFLVSQAEALEKLRLTIVKYKEQPNLPELQLPVMKKLKNLTILSEDATKERAVYSYPLIPIKPHQVPNLRILYIKPELFELFADYVFTSVEELNLCGQRFDRVADKIAAKFPNLNKLSNCDVSLHETLMMTDFLKCLSHIENLELNIRFNKYSSDFNLIGGGLPENSRWALSQVSTKVGYEALEEWIEPPGSTLYDLKRLKRLVLNFVNFENEEIKCNDRVDIDEFGLRMIFLRMSPELELILRGNFSIPADLTSKLTSHFRNVYINPVPAGIKSKPKTAPKSNGLAHPPQEIAPDSNSDDSDSDSSSSSDDSDSSSDSEFSSDSESNSDLESSSDFESSSDSDSNSKSKSRGTGSTVWQFLSRLF